MKWFSEAHREVALAKVIITVRLCHIFTFVVGVGDSEPIVGSTMSKLALNSPFRVPKCYSRGENRKRERFNVHKSEKPLERVRAQGGLYSSVPN